MMSIVGRNAVFFFFVACLEVTAQTRLWQEVTRIRGLARVTRYQHVTSVDETQGRFLFDCSGFVNYALERSDSGLFAEFLGGISQRRGVLATHPQARDYVDFLSGLPWGTMPGNGWHGVQDARKLVPGDILAWLSTHRTGNTGHVMIVAARPRLTPSTNELLVPIVDSTAHPHGNSDSRVESGASGLGGGVIVLILNEAGHPIGHRWSIGVESPVIDTRVGMGRPTGLYSFYDR